MFEFDENFDEISSLKKKAEMNVLMRQKLLWHAEEFYRDLNSNYEFFINSNSSFFISQEEKLKLFENMIKIFEEFEEYEKCSKVLKWKNYLLSKRKQTVNDVLN